MSRIKITYRILIGLLALLPAIQAYAQPEVTARVDARQITIGDQVRYFLEVTPEQNERLVWAPIPDTFSSLEVVEKGKIDTLNIDGITKYKQRLLITGWDSGMFVIPSFEFTSVPQSGDPYKVLTDSFTLLVQTIPVDTTQPFRPIADILEVKTSWRDYIWYIIGGLLAIGLIIFVIYYFRKNRATKAPEAPKPVYVEKPDEKALRLLSELEQKELWQNDKIKQYYTELTDILRIYIEERFRTPAMELTSDELLAVARRHKDMMRHYDSLSMVLQTADMAKFARATPLPQEHTDAFAHTKEFVQASKPVAINQNTDKQ